MTLTLTAVTPGSLTLAEPSDRGAFYGDAIYGVDTYGDQGGASTVTLSAVSPGSATLTSVSPGSVTLPAATPVTLTLT